MTGRIAIFNIGSGMGVSLNELVEAIGSVLGKKPDVRYLPARRIDVPSNVLDISLARKNLHWEPSVGLIDGLKLTAEFLSGV